MEVFIVVALPPLFVGSENTSEKSKGKEKKTLPSAMKILKVLSKSTLNCVLKLLDPPFTGALFLIEHINSLGIFIYYNNFMLLALFPGDESVLITRCSNR